MPLPIIGTPLAYEWSWPVNPATEAAMAGWVEKTTKQSTCRCDRLPFPHRQEWRCDEWADYTERLCGAFRALGYRGTSRDVIDADCADRQRDCEAQRRSGQL